MPYTINELSISTGRTDLTRITIAGVRAWLLGLPIAKIAERYFAVDGETPSDAEVHKIIIDLREKLIPICHQNDLEQAAIGFKNGPHGPESQRKAALDAIMRLETLWIGAESAGMVAKPTHSVDLWFSKTLASRFKRAGLTTLQSIADAANDCGIGWWRQYPRIGEKTAATVIRWLLTQKSLFIKDYVRPPLSLTPHIAPTIVLGPGSATLVPQSRIQSIAHQLDGSQGVNRGARNHLGQNNDLGAIRAWLDLRPAGSHTRRAYEKEVERFLLWAILERGKAFSSLETVDAIAYRDFLTALPSHWVGPPQNRHTAPWKPFSGPLSPRSQSYAVSVLNALCKWLVGQGYLDFNPWSGVPKAKVAEKAIQISRAIPKSPWDTLVTWLNDQSAIPENEQIRVARAAIFLLRDSGLRRAEAAAATRQFLVNDDGWDLTVIGKGTKQRTVSVSNRTVAAIKDHFIDRRVDFDECAKETPLISPVKVQSGYAMRRHEKNEAGYTPESLYQMLQATYKAFTKDMGAIDGYSMENATVHSLRHSFGVHSVAAGLEIDAIREMLGHASLKTTTIYLQGDKKRRKSQIKKLYNESS
jgi:site-specific recombinase XerD